MPTKLVLERRIRETLDIDNALHMLLVSARFVDLVRGFQSDFQIFPVECWWPDKTPAGPAFLFFTPILLDAVDREKTTVTWDQVLPDQGLWCREEGQTFVFDKDRQGNTHIWLDPNMPTQGALVSDALYGALREAGMQSFHESPHYEEI